MYHHISNIEHLKTDFDTIISIKQEIVKQKLGVTDKITQLKTVYNELVKTNTKKIFLFCLDAFYFQYKMFSMEMENIDRFRILLNNRMYCDYYKLYHIIFSHMKDPASEIDISMLDIKPFPTYKDLEPYYEYRLEDIKDIHAAILYFINHLYQQSHDQQNHIVHYNETHQAGFSISNFLHTLDYENGLLKEKITLYLNYLSFFHISQKKQLMRIYDRMNDFYNEVNENINTDKLFSVDDIQAQQCIGIDTLLEDTECLLNDTRNLFKDTLFKYNHIQISMEEIDLDETIIDLVDP